jgi:hypothetical protein
LKAKKRESMSNSYGDSLSSVIRGLFITNERSR